MLNKEKMNNIWTPVETSEITQGKKKQRAVFLMYMEELTCFHKVSISVNILDGNTL